MTRPRPIPDPPIPLAGEALAFWRRHYRRLRAGGIITREDHDSFAVLAMTWGKLTALNGIEPGAGSYREMVQYANLLKQYHAYAKQFALMPRERRAAKMELQRKETKDEFGY